MQFDALKAGVLVNVTRPNAVETLRELLREMERLSLPYLLEETSAQSLNATGLALKEILQKCGYLIVIGGDGTILTAVRAIAKQPLPLLGINPGSSFGFLTEVTRQEISQALQTIKEGGAELVPRSTLLARYQINGEKKETPALNDLVFARGKEAHLVELEVLVNGENLATYAADGLVFATAAGSTAYSLAAGGPVMFPGLNAFVMTPVCPHALMNRPVVFPKAATITLRNAQPAREVFLSADGAPLLTLGREEAIEVTLGEPVNFINPKLRSFVGKLCEKMGWQGSLKKKNN